MTLRTAGVLLASATLTALVWLLTGTQHALPELGPGEQGWSGDFRSFYLPNAEYLGERLARGELPLWNPHQGLGAPFLASLQPGVLYPPNWLHALVPVQLAFLCLAALHVALAAFLAGGLAHALGAGAAGGAVAAVAYASSMQIAGSIWSPPVLYTAAWAPGLLWAVESCIERPTGRRAAALALALGASLLAGWPYTVAIACLACGLYGGARLLAQGIRSRRAPLGELLALGLGVAGGLALAAPQLLPSLELLERSVRALGSLVEGQALGGGVTRPYDPADFVSRLLRRGFNDGIPGWICLGLASLAVMLRGTGRRRCAALLAIGGLGLLASFPSHAPVYDWLRELPVFSDFRFPFRYRLLPTLALAASAGVGVAHLARALSLEPARVRDTAIVSVLAILTLSGGPAFQTPLPFARTWSDEPDLAGQVAAHAGEDWQRTGEPRPGRVFWARRADKLRPPFSVDALHDLEPLTLARTAQILTFFESGRARTLLTLPDLRLEPGQAPGDSLAPPFFGFVTMPSRPRRALILDLLSVDTLVVEAPPSWMTERYQRIDRGGDTAVFHNPRALPRAYRVGRALREPDDIQVALSAMLTPRFAPHELALLDHPPDALLPGPGRPIPASPGSTEVLVYDAELVRLRTSGPEPAAVVLTDVHFPGWEATVDGVVTPILRANTALRAVVVPAGSHEIEMRYRPAGFRRGALLSAGVLALCIGVACRDPWRR